MGLRPAKPQDGVVWITGASSGIGRAVALEHARRGWTVAVTARREPDLESLAEDASSLAGRILAYPGDVTDSAAVAAIAASIVAAHGPIARMILNAGAYLPVSASKLEVGAFRRSFDLNLMGVVNGLAAVLPAMIARGHGQVAITGSVAGYGGLPNAAAYGATKAGLINLAASLRFDLDNDGVLMQIASPGFVKTAATDSNAFPMPFLMEAGAAATRYVDGLDTTRFEIVFPRRFALILKALNILPYRVYFAAVSRATGWRGRRD